MPSSRAPRCYPPGVAPQRVRLIGTTWVERGSAYWLRRTLLAVGRLYIIMVLLLCTAEDWHLLATAAWSRHWRVPLDVLLLVMALGGVVLGVVHAGRTLSVTRTPLEWQEARRSTRLPSSPRAYVIPVLLTAPVSLPFCAGFGIVYLAALTFGRELPAERGARAELERVIAEARQ